MNALNQAIKAVNEITVANAKWAESVRESIDWAKDGKVFTAERRAREASQVVEIIAPNGSNVQISSIIASGNIRSHCRNTFKVDGKRAKAEDVAKMF